MDDKKIGALVSEVFSGDPPLTVDQYSDREGLKIYGIYDKEGAIGSFVRMSGVNYRFTFNSKSTKYTYMFILDLLDDEDRVKFLYGMLDYIVNYLKEYHPTIAEDIPNIDTFELRRMDEFLGYEFE